MSLQNWETKTSFLEDSRLETICEGVYVYRGFIEEDTVKEINTILESKLNDATKNYQTLIDWYDDKILMDIHEMYPVWEKISQFLFPTHVIHPRSEVAVIRPGDGGMPPHSDSPGEGHGDQLTQYDVWNTCTILDYGVVLYFGDFTGGALYYPNLNIELTLNPGDLAIHGAHGQHLHGVREVETGIRFAFANFCLPAHKNPGSFINFNTEDFHTIRQQENFLTEYHKPLKTNDREYKKNK